MTNARLYRRRTEKIVSTWLDRGRFAYIVQLEVRGAPDQPAAEVIEASSNALRKTLAGPPWTRMKNRYEMAGKVMTVSMTRTADYRWAVRRRVIIGGGRDLEEQELASISKSMGGHWTRGSGQMESHATEIRQVLGVEVAALAQFVTGCMSPQDPPVEPFAAIHKMEFEPAIAERTATDLVAKFREQEGYRRSAFVEYAQSMARVPVWSAQVSSNRSRSPGKFTDAWDDLLVRARDQVISGQLDMKKGRSERHVQRGGPKKV